MLMLSLPADFIILRFFQCCFFVDLLLLEMDLDVDPDEHSRCFAQ